jgi:hypothetical protein
MSGFADWLRGITFGPGATDAEVEQTLRLCRAAYTAGSVEAREVAIDECVQVIIDRMNAGGVTPEYAFAAGDITMRLLALKTPHPPTPPAA